MTSLTRALSIVHGHALYYVFKIIAFDSRRYFFNSALL